MCSFAWTCHEELSWAEKQFRIVYNPYRIQHPTVVVRLAFVSNDNKFPHQFIGRSVSFSVDVTIHLTSSMSIASPHSIVSQQDTLAGPSKSTPSTSARYYSSSDRSVSEEQLEYKGGTRKVLTLDLREPLWQLPRGQYRPSRYSVHHAEVLRQRLGRHLNLELRLCRAISVRLGQTTLRTGWRDEVVESGEEFRSLVHEEGIRWDTPHIVSESGHNSILEALGCVPLAEAIVLLHRTHFQLHHRPKAPREGELKWIKGHINWTLTRFEQALCLGNWERVTTRLVARPRFGLLEYRQPLEVRKLERRRRVLVHWGTFTQLVRYTKTPASIVKPQTRLQRCATMV